MHSEDPQVVGTARDVMPHRPWCFWRGPAALMVLPRERGHLGRSSSPQKDVVPERVRATPRSCRTGSPSRGCPALLSRGHLVPWPGSPHSPPLKGLVPTWARPASNLGGPEPHPVLRRFPLQDLFPGSVARWGHTTPPSGNFCFTMIPIRNKERHQNSV